MKDEGVDKYLDKYKDEQGYVWWVVPIDEDLWAIAVDGPNGGGAMYVVWKDEDGDPVLNLDTDSDMCGLNPADKDGCWPSPPDHLVEEASGLSSRVYEIEE